MKKLKDITKHTYVGNCVNSFDENGNCNTRLPYRDTTDFAQSEEKYSKISKQKFKSSVNIPNHLSNVYNSKNTTFHKDNKNNVHIMYDNDKDVHHFFMD